MTIYFPVLTDYKLWNLRQLIMIGVKPTTRPCLKWLDKMVEMCAPQDVRWCDGSDQEWDELCGLMIGQGSMIELNERKAPQ